MSGDTLPPYQKTHFAVWPGITYFKVSPRWARYSDFRANPPRITEIRF